MKKSAKWSIKVQLKSNNVPVLFCFIVIYCIYYYKIQWVDLIFALHACFCCCCCTFNKTHLQEHVQVKMHFKLKAIRCDFFFVSFHISANTYVKVCVHYPNLTMTSSQSAFCRAFIWSNNIKFIYAGKCCI